VLTKHLLLRKEDLTHVVDQLDFCLLVGGKGKVVSFISRALHVLGFGF
jgi:hypothetical protein